MRRYELHAAAPRDESGAARARVRADRGRNQRAGPARPLASCAAARRCAPAARSAGFFLAAGARRGRPRAPPAERSGRAPRRGSPIRSSRPAGTRSRRDRASRDLRRLPAARRGARARDGARALARITAGAAPPGRVGRDPRASGPRRCTPPRAWLGARSAGRSAAARRGGSVAPPGRRRVSHRSDDVRGAGDALGRDEARGRGDAQGPMPFRPPAASATRRHGPIHARRAATPFLRATGRAPWAPPSRGAADPGLGAADAPRDGRVDPCCARRWTRTAAAAT